MMTETSQSEPLELQTNGIGNGLNNEDERSKMRPADIEADVKEMERRKRVELIMNSKLFREELERIIELQMKDGNGPAGLLQQISDMMGIQTGKLHTTQFRGSNCVTPINDIRGVESMGYAKGEKNLRCKLASVFRLMDLYGWSQGINNQITVRLNQDEEHFLINPYGMLYNEITASSLVKVDMQGNIVESGTTNFSVNTQGFLLHSSIHAARPDIKCIIHIHTPSVLAVSSLKCGLLPLCQEALVIGEVSQHPFVSGISEPEEREKIIRNLGPTNKVLLLNNHGAVCCGSTVEEAFYNVYNTVLACETQIKLMPMGIEHLVLVNDETRKQVYDAAHRAPETSATTGQAEKKQKQFRVGELEFEALIRMLDNAGFRTGYIYRHPLVKGEVPKPKNDVEVPPAVSSLGYLIEEEEMYKQGNWKKYIDGRNRHDRTKWLNSPNVYQKVEILETGTPDPKKITKWVDQNSEEWVAEGSPTHSSTPVKIDSALQFVPKNTNPKEFKKLQQQIKENRLADKITSGPQSHILEGVTWEEARKLQDANITQTGDQVIIVGAASKGIIQRNFQHNAMVYKTPYAKNPFDNMSDKELEEYKRTVERKQRGDTDYEESQSESEAVSSSRQDVLRHIKSPLLSPQSATSETEEESRDEPRVLRIETKTAPRPIQAEVVLSDAEFDMTDARVERSQSARYPKAEKPESVTIINSFRKSWSLKRDKEKHKDVDSPDEYESRYSQPSPVLTDYGSDRTDSFQRCIARIKQLTHIPVLVDVNSESFDPLLRSNSEPSCFSNRKFNKHSRIGQSSSLSDLQNRLRNRKMMIYNAKMKFLESDTADVPVESCKVDGSPSSPVCLLISEIRDTITQISAKESTEEDDGSGWMSSLRWRTRPRFVPQAKKQETCLNRSYPSVLEKDVASPSSFHSLRDEVEAEDALNRTFEVQNEGKTAVIDDEGGDLDRNNASSLIFDAQEVKSLLTSIFQMAEGMDETSNSITEDSVGNTYSFTDTTDTDWYYNKTILKPNNSQTVVEVNTEDNVETTVVEIVEEKENQDVQGIAGVKFSDTGIDTDYTSDKDHEDASMKSMPQQDSVACEVPGLNKSSETDSSFMKTSSGQATSNDVDTSSAFKGTETENDSFKEAVTLDVIEESTSFKPDSNNNTSDAGEVVCSHEDARRLPDIPESPEFMNVDTEDAPATSSSKDTSPDVPGQGMDYSKEETTEPKQAEQQREEHDEGPTNRNLNRDKVKKDRKGSSTKITLKKELQKENSKPIVSEIKLTIKNKKQYKSQKFELEIQDTSSTSEEMSRTTSSLSESVEGYESYEVVEGNCECDAQQNLEVLQEEVSTTIERLQNIENYFEEEIQRISESSTEPSKQKDTETRPSESSIEYHYQENEEALLNEPSASPIKDECIPTENHNQVYGSVHPGPTIQGPAINEVYIQDGCDMSFPDFVAYNVEVATNEESFSYQEEQSDSAELVRGIIDSVIDEASDISRSEDINAVRCFLEELLEKSIPIAEKETNTFKTHLGNLSSPSDSLEEFEDLEKVISVSESLIDEVVDSTETYLRDIQDVEDVDLDLDLDADLDADLDLDLEEPANDSLSPKTERRRRDLSLRKCKSSFNIVIATPTRKDIYINYSACSSSCFNVSQEEDGCHTDHELPAIAEEDPLCNSYIKTDEVNDDFESYSLSSCDWFSVDSQDKNSSLNSSFCSVSSVPESRGSPRRYPNPCFLAEYDDSAVKSPRNLDIIFEVGEEMG